MRVAVIGGCGVLGSWVTAELAAAGVAPVVLDYREDRTILDVAAPGVPLRLVDIRSEHDLASTLAAVDADRVVNVAALMPDACEEDPLAAIDINLKGAVNVVRAAALIGIDRIVFFSSRAALGEVADPYLGPAFQPIPETLGINPKNVYGSVKAAAERICGRIATAAGVDLACLRLASTYGPGKSARHGELAIISHVVESAAAGRAVELPLGGDQLNDFVYCRDVGHAAALATTSPRPVDGIYHIGSGTMATLGHVAEVVRRRIPDAKIRIGAGLDYRRRGRTAYVRMSIEKARETFGYEPTYDIVRGVDDYLDLLLRPGGAAGDTAEGVPETG